jgi:hypothetical protein
MTIKQLKAFVIGFLNLLSPTLSLPLTAMNEKRNETNTFLCQLYRSSENGNYPK